MDLSLTLSPNPSPTTVAFVVGGAPSVAAGAFAAIQATAGRLTIGWTGPWQAFGCAPRARFAMLRSRRAGTRRDA